MAKSQPKKGDDKPETKDEAARRRGREVVERDQADLQNVHDKVKSKERGALGEEGST